MTENKASKRSIKYDATHTKRYYIKLNLETDKDIIEALERIKETEGVQTYIKRIIRIDNLWKKREALLDKVQKILVNKEEQHRKLTDAENEEVKRLIESAKDLRNKIVTLRNCV